MRNSRCPYREASTSSRVVRAHHVVLARPEQGDHIPLPRAERKDLSSDVADVVHVLADDVDPSRNPNQDGRPAAKRRSKASCQPQIAVGPLPQERPVVSVYIAQAAQHPIARERALPIAEIHLPFRGPGSMLQKLSCVQQRSNEFVNIQARLHRRDRHRAYPPIKNREAASDRTPAPNRQGDRPAPPSGSSRAAGKSPAENERWRPRDLRPGPR